MREPPSVKPIETIYQGYRFRSRTEARWAVAFSAVGIQFEYEPERYSLPNERLGTYLPDFYTHDLPEKNIRSFWIEVKGSDPTQDARDKLAGLCDMFFCEGLLLVGQPDPNGYFYHYRTGEGGRRRYEQKKQTELSSLLGLDEPAFTMARQARFEATEVVELPPPTIIPKPSILTRPIVITRSQGDVIEKTVERIIYRTVVDEAALNAAWHEIRILWWIVAIEALLICVLFYAAYLE